MAYSAPATGRLVDWISVPEDMRAIIRFEMEAEAFKAAFKKTRKVSFSTRCGCDQCQRLLTFH